MRNRKGYGRKRPCFILRRYTSICVEGIDNVSEEWLVRTGELRAKNQTRDIPNTKQECQPFNHDFCSNP
jgi:hypothetical protein